MNNSFHKISMVILLIILTIGLTVLGRAAITQISGLAVAQSATQWNNVKDAALGDNLTSGILVNGSYWFDGTNWDRARGDTTNGLWVNIKATVPITINGNKTPSDAYANPTDALDSWSLLGIWNGATWDRWKSSTHGDNLTTTSGANVASFGYIFDGTNWDRARGGADNSANPTMGKLSVLSARANAAAPIWTEGYQVPLSVDLSGNLRTSASVSGTIIIAGNKTPSDAYANPTDALDTMSLLAIWNGATWDRAKSISVGGNQTSGILAIGNYVYDADGTTWRRLRDVGVDGIASNGLGAFVPYMWNGATYDRATGDATNGLKVQGTVSPPLSGTAFYAIKRDNIAGVSVNLAFGFTSKKIVVETPSTNTDEICIDWIGGTAVCPAANTAGDDRIAAGRSIILDDYAGTSISVIAASGTQTVYVRAYN
jgi:hypothetical protein